MNLIRLLTVLTLLPITALSGVPHVACRCSNGEIRLSCPRLARSQKAADSKSCCKSPKTTDRKLCCCGTKDTSCCGSSGRQSADDGASCCAAGCRCTPVYLTAEVGPKLTKVCVPDIVQLDLGNLSATELCLDLAARMDLCRIESKPDVPIDIIVLYARFLI